MIKSITKYAGEGGRGVGTAGCQRVSRCILVLNLTMENLTCDFLGHARPCDGGGDSNKGGFDTSMAPYRNFTKQQECAPFFKSRDSVDWVSF